MYNRIIIRPSEVEDDDLFVFILQGMGENAAYLEHDHKALAETIRKVSRRDNIEITEFVWVANWRWAEPVIITAW